jgi:purine-binding chemotaxis protein CheW
MNQIPRAAGSNPPPASAEGDGAPHLIVRAADVAIALHAESALEVWQAERCHPVPGTPAYVIGIASFRGTPLPLVDLGAALRLRAPAGRPSLDDRRAVVISSGAYLVGLAVEGLAGVVDVALPRARKPSVVGVGRLAELAVCEIDLPAGGVAAVLDLPAFLEAVRVRS